MPDPSMLLLDEPTSGVDPVERVVIRNVLHRLQGEHRLTLTSSPLPLEVAEICDRVIFINQGKIVLQDTVENIGNRSRVTSLDVEFSVPVNPSAIARFPGVTRGVPLSATQFRVDFDGSAAARAQILEGSPKVAPLISLGSATLTLEDACTKLLAPEHVAETTPRHARSAVVL
jgi:ABC-type multidrug transport system ATPase subunit